MVTYDGAKVLNAIRSIHMSKNERDTVAVLTDFVGQYGFSRVFLGQLVNPANIPPSDILNVSNWPIELMHRRKEQMAILNDPIAICALRSKRPFRWSEAQKYASSRGRRVVDLARDYGITDGFMFPMHSLDSVSGGVSVGGGKPICSHIEVSELEIVCQAAYYHLEEMLGPFPYQKVAELTERETEVVQFAAAGKTNWEIAKILGLKADTVNKCLQRASRKLKTVNRAHTVAVAIAQSQIFP